MFSSPFYAVYSSQEEINFLFFKVLNIFCQILQKYPSLQSLTLHSHEAQVYRKVKGKSRGSSKGNKVLPMRCAPLGHPERDF
jgi:hypothetical protein